MPQGGIIQGMWWIIYFGDQPSVMTNAPTKEKALGAFREMMLGHKLPEDLVVKSIMEVDAADLLRAYVAASMALMTSMAGALSGRPRGMS